MTQRLQTDRFAALVEEHQASLRAFVRSLGVHLDWVDDLAQDAFVVAHGELDNFDQEQDFGKWLRGIARNLVRNELRKTGRRRVMHEALTRHLLAAEEKAPQRFEADEVAALQDCLGQLPSKSRELVQERYHEDSNASRMAEKFQMKAATIRQTLLRIRRQLYQCINQRVKEA